MNTRYTKKEFEKLLTEKLFNEFAIDIASATDEQIYRALALIARGMLSEKRNRAHLRRQRQAGVLPVHGISDGPQPEDQPA